MTRDEKIGRKKRELLDIARRTADECWNWMERCKDEGIKADEIPQIAAYQQAMFLSSSRLIGILGDALGMDVLEAIGPDAPYREQIELMHGMSQEERDRVRDEKDYDAIRLRRG